MNVTVELINASKEPDIPSLSEFQYWANSAMASLAIELSPSLSSFELSLRLMDEDESAFLNENFRQKQGPTNILSFPGAVLPIEGVKFLGDLAICAPVVCKEALEQNKHPKAHWAHMVVHGVLHLNAFDHEGAHEAQTMENLEINILNDLGFANPYR